MVASKTYSQTPDYVRITASTDFNTATTSALTWVTLAAEDTTFDGAFAKDVYPSNGSWYLGKNNADKTYLSTDGGGGEALGSDYVLNQWRHITGAVETSDSDLYENGTNVGTDTSTYTASNTDILIGGRPKATPDELWNGNAAYSQVYNRKLTTQETIECMWNPFSLPSGLVGMWWGMDGGTTEIDRSGNGHNGTVTGTTNSTSGPPVFFLGGQ